MIDERAMRSCSMTAAVAGLVLLLSACATTSGVMEAEGGTFLISAAAAPARGGTAGAHAVAYEEAQKFCATKGGRAIVIVARERDAYQSAAGASWGPSGGGAAGGTFAAGRVMLHFRCAN